MIEHLVVDSGGFIKNAPIRELCRNAYTIPEVVSEIKDRETRKRLKVSNNSRITKNNLLLGITVRIEIFGSKAGINSKS